MIQHKVWIPSSDVGQLDPYSRLFYHEDSCKRTRWSSEIPPRIVSSCFVLLCLPFNLTEFCWCLLWVLCFVTSQLMRDDALVNLLIVLPLPFCVASIGVDMADSGQKRSTMLDGCQGNLMTCIHPDFSNEYSSGLQKFHLPWQSSLHQSSASVWKTRSSLSVWQCNTLCMYLDMSLPDHLILVIVSVVHMANHSIAAHKSYIFMKVPNRITGFSIRAKI